MSLQFCCGQGGCEITEIDDYAHTAARWQTGKWACEQEARRGRFPSLQEQAEYFEAAYRRMTEIRMAQI